MMVLSQKRVLPTVISEKNGQNRSRKNIKIRQKEQYDSKTNTQNHQEMVQKSVKKTYFPLFQVHFFTLLI
jgi:hypothetical protein